MEGIKGIDTATISLQLKSLVIYEFLKEYNELERVIREIFEKNISNIPTEVLYQFYFYYGGKIGTHIEYEAHTLKLDSIVYKEGEKFKNLSINQIVKILRTRPCIKIFDFSVESVQHSTTVFPFYDCVIRLINMRNRLAHEMVDLHFKDKDLIELLSYEQIAQESFQLLQNYDIKKMDDMTLYIASNIVYMHKLLDRLHSTIE